MGHISKISQNLVSKEFSPTQISSQKLMVIPAPIIHRKKGLTTANAQVTLFQEGEPTPCLDQMTLGLQVLYL